MSISSNQFVTSTVTEQSPNVVGALTSNNILYLTKDLPSNGEVFNYYNSDSAVAANYGVNSQTYKDFIKAISQKKTFQDGLGSFCIASLINSIDATSGSFTTSALTIANFQTVTNGFISVNVDGVNYLVENLNFTGVETVQDILDILLAGIITTVFGNAIVYGVANGVVETTTIKLNSNSVGTTSTIVLAQPTIIPTVGTDLSGANYFNVSAGVATTGTNATGETIEEAIIRLNNLGTKPQFLTVVTNKLLDDATFLSDSAYIQSQSASNYIFLYAFASVNQLATSGIINQNTTLQQNNVRLLEYSGNPQNALSFATSACSRIASNDFNTPQGANNVFLQQQSIVGFEQDYAINDAMFAQAALVGADVYTAYQANDDGFYVENATNDLYIDSIVNSVMLNQQLKARFQNLLKTTIVRNNAKGLARLKAEAIAVCIKAVINGIIVNGNEWKVSTYPSDISKQTFEAAIIEKGYYVAIPTLSTTNTRIATVTVYANIGGIIMQIAIPVILQNN